MNKNISLFFFVATAFGTAFFFQNCSDLSQLNLDQRQSYFPPVFITDFQFFNQPIVAEACVAQEELLYSKKYNLCFMTVDSCEVQSLYRMGFKEDTGDCGSYSTIQDLKSNQYKSESLSNLGYQSDPELVCASVYQKMVNHKTRSCVDGPDSCSISFLEEEGYMEDNLELCE